MSSRSLRSRGGAHAPAVAVGQGAPGAARPRRAAPRAPARYRSESEEDEDEDDDEDDTVRYSLGPGVSSDVLESSPVFARFSASFAADGDSDSGGDEDDTGEVDDDISDEEGVGDDVEDDSDDVDAGDTVDDDLDEGTDEGADEDDDVDEGDEEEVDDADPDADEEEGAGEDEGEGEGEESGDEVQLLDRAPPRRRRRLNNSFTRPALSLNEVIDGVTALKDLQDGTFLRVCLTDLFDRLDERALAQAQWLGTVFRALPPSVSSQLVSSSILPALQRAGAVAQAPPPSLSARAPPLNSELLSHPGTSFVGAQPVGGRFLFDNAPFVRLGQSLRAAQLGLKPSAFVHVDLAAAARLIVLPRVLGVKSVRDQWLAAPTPAGLTLSSGARSALANGGLPRELSAVIAWEDHVLPLAAFGVGSLQPIDTVKIQRAMEAVVSWSVALFGADESVNKELARWLPRALSLLTSLSAESVSRIWLSATSDWNGAVAVAVSRCVGEDEPSFRAQCCEVIWPSFVSAWDKAVQLEAAAAVARASVATNSAPRASSKEQDAPEPDAARSDGRSRQRTTKEVCRSYQRTGTCSYGPGCFYEHPGDGEPMRRRR